MSDLKLREKVATLVMGLKVRVIKNDDGFHAGEWVRCYDGGSWCKDYLGDGGLVVDRENDMSREVPHYESDIAAAWLVVEAMAERGWSNFALSTCAEGWYADFAKPLGATMRETASAPPMAICLAAKAAIEGEG